MTRRPRQVPPLARSEGLLLEQVGSETVVYDPETREAHCLSALAAAVFAECDGRTPVDRIAERAGSRMGEPINVQHVEAAIEQLEQRGLLSGPMPAVARSNGLSRRQLMHRTAGATAALSAVPLVTSIVTPAFAQASPARRCPSAMCVSQEKGDEFCACNNVCPPGSPGAGGDTSCTDLGLTPPYFDSCFCAKCPTVGDPNPGQVPQGFEHLCPPMPFTPAPCSGDNTQGGCNNSGKPLDGVCVPNDGDSSELCINQGGPPI